MRFFILGGTGFIGRHLIRFLLDGGHEVAALVRSRGRFSLSHPCLTLVDGDPTQPGGWQETLSDADTIINLTGAPVSMRWTDKAKKVIMESRIRSTQLVVEGLKGLPPKTLICANAIGYFGDRGNEILEEHAASGTGFLAEVARAWQEEAEKARDFGHRVVITRFCLVLGRSGGAMKEMLPIFRLGLGGRLGPGTQWFSWVHIDDLVRAVLFAAEHQEMQGPVNVCSPNPVTNREFTKTLGTTLKRPTIVPVPSGALRLVLGEAADLALASLRCRPGVLEGKDFEFRFPELGGALKDLVGKG